jgi:cytochrome c553
MHNSADNPVRGTPNNTLLKGSTASDTCLNCHKGNGRYRISSTDGTNVNEGGDFFWVGLTYTVMVRGNPVNFEGDDHGHNVIANDFGMQMDAKNGVAPGGTYPASDLGCNSCHDPHGQVGGGTGVGQLPIGVSGSYGGTAPDGTIVGNYRLLGDSSYAPPGGGTFSADAPIARADSYAGANTDYGSGMSEWCGNCHGEYINDSHKHPAGDGEHLGVEGSNYNSYVATGDFEGSIGTAYDALVPFERGVTDGSLLDPFSTQGPDGNANVMCLTCHRAHASAHENAGRWDFGVTLLAESHALESPDVPSGAAVYYANGSVVDIGSRYGEYQRSLCNKCHVQD